MYPDLICDFPNNYINHCGVEEKKNKQPEIVILSVLPLEPADYVA